MLGYFNDIRRYLKGYERIFTNMLGYLKILQWCWFSKGSFIFPFGIFNHDIYLNNRPLREIKTIRVWSEKIRILLSSIISSHMGLRCSMYGIFTYIIYHKFKANLGKYTSPMEHMGTVWGCFFFWYFFIEQMDSEKARHEFSRGNLVYP